MSKMFKYTNSELQGATFPPGLISRQPLLCPVSPDDHCLSHSRSPRASPRAVTLMHAGSSLSIRTEATSLKCGPQRSRVGAGSLHLNELMGVGQGLDAQGLAVSSCTLLTELHHQVQESNGNCWISHLCLR